VPGPSRRLDRAFRTVVALKGLDGVLEVIGGIVLLFISPASINHLVRWATAHELAQDPHDAIARHLLHSASMLSPRSTLYGAIYLLVHGGSKVVLVVAVLRRKLWAYPWIIALLVIFIVYQSYQLSRRFGIGLLLLTLFDVAVTILTWREYQGLLQERATSAVS
jgi:uncharacterized membrane protein